MSIFQMSVTCSFFQDLCSHIDKNPWGKFENMFLVKIASKGISLKALAVPEAFCKGGGMSAFLVSFGMCD